MAIEQLLLNLVLLLAAAKIFGEIAERRGQPAVLGELLGGIVAGPGVLGLLAHRFHGPQFLSISVDAPVLQMIAGIGVILLMFEVGLETDMDDLLRLGFPALWVAGVGVALPFAAGYAVMSAFGAGSVQCILVGATLTATSVGITARSFADLGCSRTLEARLVLGAAVADDVIGLIILAAVAGLGASQTVSAAGIARAGFVAIAFLLVSSWLGRRFAPLIVRYVSRMRTRAALSTAALMFCFLMAAGAQILGGLSPMIGAFAAGLVLAKTEHRVHFEARIKPVADLFVPVFFVLVGAAMPISAVFTDPHGGRELFILFLTLLVVAIAGKIGAGITVPVRGINRLAVGIAMMPRGEVALVFAGFGIAAKIFTPQLYVVVLMVVLATTVLTPPLLKAALRGRMSSPPDAEDTTQEPPPASAISMSAGAF